MRGCARVPFACSGLVQAPLAMSRLCCIASQGRSGATREVCCPEVHKDRIVCAFVSLIEAHLFIVVHNCPLQGLRLPRAETILVP